MDAGETVACFIDQPKNVRPFPAKMFFKTRFNRNDNITVFETGMAIVFLDFGIKINSRQKEITIGESPVCVMIFTMEFISGAASKGQAPELMPALLF